MTREEAIKELELIAKVTMWNDRREAVEMAIEALQTEVVWCKDCRHRYEEGDCTHYYWCRLHDRPVDDTDFCSCGEESEVEE